MDERFKDGTVHLYIVWEIEKFLARYGTYTEADVFKYVKLWQAKI